MTLAVDPPYANIGKIDQIFKAAGTLVIQANGRNTIASKYKYMSKKFVERCVELPPSRVAEIRLRVCFIEAAAFVPG